MKNLENLSVAVDNLELAKLLGPEVQEEFGISAESLIRSAIVDIGQYINGLVRQGKLDAMATGQGRQINPLFELTVQALSL